MNQTPHQSSSNLSKEQIEAIVQQQISLRDAPPNMERLQARLDELEKKLNEKSDEKIVEEQKKGLPLNGFLEFTRFYSTNASSVNRSLALAGIAIIWLFKWPKDGKLDGDLLNLPLFFLALSLALDLLQYLAGASAWLIFYEWRYNQWKKREYKPEEAKDIVAPNGISWPLWGLFFLKIISMCVAYYFIIEYLVDLFYAQSNEDR